MISICIPVFNNDVRKLVMDLLDQIRENDQSIEIILVDDASRTVVKSQYPEIENDRTRVILLDKNIGRARIRNFFLQHSRNDYLLFLDGDSTISNPEFLNQYLQCIRQKPDVVCGGRVYAANPSSRLYRLHWKYGSRRESRTLAARKKDPQHSFMSHNFLVRREIFHAIRFNEDLVEYGHEDTLLGFEFTMAGISIDHIDNPVLHGELATNAEFLVKTASGIRNLVTILNNLDKDPEFISYVSLLRVYFKLRKFGIHQLLYIMAPLFTPLATSVLRKGWASLRLFDFFKLLVLARVYKAKQSSRKL